jgi:zinc D-Ala-D-Ala carboxypeptidase
MSLNNNLASLDSQYFTEDELRCQETGILRMDPEFMSVLDKLREACGFPFIITSGYRSPDHSLERTKDRIGAHAMGLAVDIRASSSQRYKIMQEGMKLGITRFGINRSFIHIDIADWNNDRFPSNVVWAY